MGIENDFLREINNSLIFNDMFNAKKFVEQHKNYLKFCNPLGGWFIYNGQIWERDESSEILNYAEKTYESLIGVPINEMDETAKKRWKTHIKATGNERNIKSLINLSKMKLSVKKKMFDNDNYLICLKNGIYDLKNFKLFPFSPEHMFTMQSNFSYNPAATCPNWERFLKIVFINDEKMIKYIQKCLGYCLTGDISRQMFFIMKGGGQNGKSTLLQTILYGMGDYGTTLDSESIIKKFHDEGIRNDLACLNKKRFIPISELDKSKELHISLVKKMTTLTPMKVRFLRKEFFEMMPTFKMFLETNPLPTIKGEDKGTWRRLRRVDFDYSFDDSNSIQDYQQQYLNPEIDGIFNWLIEGLKALTEEGEQMPEKVQIANQEYKDDENLLTDFFDECCVRDDNTYILCSDFHKYYKNINIFDKEKYVVGKKNIPSALAGLGIKKMRINVREEDNNHGKHAYFGFRCTREIIGKKDWEDSILIPSTYSINGNIDWD